MTDASRRPRPPGPRQLPGIEGFYLLTPGGELGRYRPDGEFSVNPDLTQRLADRIELLLSRYRGGEVEALAIGLVMPRMPDQSWRSASLVFSDRALGTFFRTSNDSGAPLTAFQKRNRIKSIFQGMEVVLNVRDATEPQYPGVCPVLFVPEVDAAMLRSRYGLDAVEPQIALEVLDLMDHSAPEDKRQPLLSRMVMEMLRTRIAPEMRSSPELTVAAGAGAPSSGTGGPAGEEPPAGRPVWRDVPEERATAFNEGDPVTYWLLAWFSPFSELNDLQRQFIARGYTVSRRRAGETLVERGSLDDVSIYLIEGTLELEAFDGKKIDVVGGTKQAHLPISQLRPHAYTVRAATDATVILVSQKMIREVTRITTTYQNRTGIEVTEESMLPDGIPGFSAGG